MNKIHKAWLSLLVVLFAIPEILWSPIGNFIYESGQRTNNIKPLRESFLTQTDNFELWANIVLFQFICLLLITIYIAVLKKQFKNQRIYWAGLIIMSVITIYVFLLYSYSTIKVTL